MTKAEQLRKITDEALAKVRAEKVAKHKAYADKIISGKCRFYAGLGKGSVKVKLRKKFSPSLVVDAIVDHGFAVIESSKNGRAILTIKW
jgi:hypothetical protein